MWNSSATRTRCGNNSRPRSCSSICGSGPWSQTGSGGAAATLKPPTPKPAANFRSPPAQRELNCSMPIGAFKTTSVLLAILACASWALGQQAKPVYRGEWKGSAGPAFMHGRWAGQADPQNPDLARGSWTLQGEHGDIVLEGTWSARKLARGWRGTWTAHTAAGRSYAGSWTA